MTDTTISFATFAPGEDRQLLADIHRWARANGWNWHEYWGWVNARYALDANLAVDWVNGQVVVRRAEAGVFGGVFRPTRYDVATVREAVDILAALGIVPEGFSSAYKAGWDDCATLTNAHFGELKLASQGGVR